MPSQICSSFRPCCLGIVDELSNRFRLSRIPNLVIFCFVAFSANFSFGYFPFSLLYDPLPRNLRSNM